MIILQTNATNIINTNGFSDNFFWPLMVAIVIGVFAVIWNFFLRKKFKITINHNESFIGTNNGHDYAIININFVNETSTPINNLRIISSPNYSFLKDIWGMVGGRRDKSQTIFPYPVKLTNNEIDASQPINIGADNNLEGNLIIDIQNRNNQINSIELSYLTKKIKLEILFNNLKIKQL